MYEIFFQDSFKTCPKTTPETKSGILLRKMYGIFFQSEFFWILDLLSDLLRRIYGAFFYVFFLSAFF